MTIGHNNPPPYDAAELESVRAATAEWLKAGKDWLAIDAIPDAITAGKAQDFLTQLRNAWKRADKVRREAKQPHDDAAKAVQAAYAPSLTALEGMANKMKAKLAAWAKMEKARQAEEAKLAASLAAEEQERAEAEAANAAMRGDIQAELEAQARAEAAADAASRQSMDGGKVTSFTGAGRTGSLRTVRSVRVVKLGDACRHYQRAPELRECLEKLARAELRAAKGKPVEIPGFVIEEEEVYA